MIPAEVYIIYEIINNKTVSLKHPLAQNSCEFEIKRVHCMMNIYLKWIITFFFPTNSNSMGSHSYILGSLRHRHHELALSWRKQFLRKRQGSNNYQLTKKMIGSFHVFSEAIYRLIRMGHESISVLIFGFNNYKCMTLVSHASGLSVSM